MIAGFIGSQRDAGVRQKFPYGLDVHLVACAAVVRVVQKGFNLVQRHLEASAVGGLDIGTKVIEQ